MRIRYERIQKRFFCLSHKLFASYPSWFRIKGCITRWDWSTTWPSLPSTPATVLCYRWENIFVVTATKIGVAVISNFYQSGVEFEFCGKPYGRRNPQATFCTKGLEARSDGYFYSTFSYSIASSHFCCLCENCHRFSNLQAWWTRSRGWSSWESWVWKTPKYPMSLSDISPSTFPRWTLSSETQNQRSHVSSSTSSPIWPSRDVGNWRTEGWPCWSVFLLFFLNEIHKATKSLALNNVSF